MISSDEVERSIVNCTNAQGEWQDLPQCIGMEGDA